MKLFLQLKHWQLFGLLCGLPVVFQFLVNDILINNAGSPLLIWFFAVMMLVIAVVYFGWFYAIGTWLYKRLPVKSGLKLNRFKFAVFFPVGYIAVALFLVREAMINVSSGAQLGAGMFAVILPVHLFSMACMLYALRFNAKALKSVESREPVKFSDYAGEFFLLWFFPIGIWFIQPRINKLFNDSLHEGNDLMASDL